MYWSRFSADLADRETRVVGEALIGAMKTKLARQQGLGSVIEFGCGSGLFTKSIIAEATAILATDFSEEMVAEARRIFHDQPKVRVEQADCCGTSYGDASFDTVLMVNLLHVIPEPQLALREAHRVLKEHGMLLATCFSTEKMSLPHKMQLLFRYRKTFGPFPRNRTSFTVRSLGKVVSEAGFLVQETVLLGRTTRSIFLKAQKRQEGPSGYSGLF